MVKTILEVEPMTFIADYPIQVWFKGFSISKSGDLIIYDTREHEVIRFRIAKLRVIE